MCGPSIPAYIFTVRHGARLDAADSNWHLTSATPYDPPLTYGGWMQARSLGHRIASILHSRNSFPSASSLSLNEPKPKGTETKAKQTRIVIHTSPFLRCIQTSIGISAGISMHWGQQQQQQENASTKEYIKPILRVDAWLGEWLTPDYFTEISPPPATVLLAATSKTDLMRPSSAHAIRPPPSTNSPALPLNNFARDLENNLPGAVPLASYLPPVPGYAISPNGPIPRGYVSHAKEFIEIDYAWNFMMFGTGGEYGEEWATMHKRFRAGYKQMLKWFATNDAQVTALKTVWGKPGGSKWSSGIGSFDGSNTIVNVPSSDSKVDNHDQQDGATGDRGIETVVILVTHGAGCNALIGAMTDKPVLMDIGLASMTMAERIDQPKQLAVTKPLLKSSYITGIISSPAASPSDTAELNIAYDVKVMASTEHLRRGSVAAISGVAGGNSPKLVGRDTPPPSLHAFRSRFGGGVPTFGGSNNSSTGGWTIFNGGSGAGFSPITENGLEDVSKVPAIPRRSSVASTVSSTGLWSRPVTAAGSNGADETGSGSENAGMSRSSSGVGDKFIDKERLDRNRSASTRLMSSTGSSDDAEKAAGSEDSESADEGPGTWIERKRRWTMDQASRRAQM